MAQGIGIKFPIQLGSTGHFAQTFTTIENAKSNLFNLLLTRRGERPMQPLFGLDIRRQIFEQNTGDFAVILQRTIQQTIDFWLPYIIIENIDINQDPEIVDANRVEISLTFSIEQAPNRHETIILEFNF